MGVPHGRGRDCRACHLCGERQTVRQRGGGLGGAFSLIGGGNGQFKTPGRLLTFALDAKETVPIAPQTLPKLTALPLDADKKTIDQGAVLYAQWCFVCHGVGATSGGSLADLRYSAPAIFEQYPRIVLEGSFRGAGMPSLKQWVSASDVAAIRAYVIAMRNRRRRSSRARYPEGPRALHPQLNRRIGRYTLSSCNAVYSP